MEAPNYRTLATSEPVAVPAVDAWRREAARRERGIAIRFAARGGIALVAMACMFVIQGMRDPVVVALTSTVMVSLMGIALFVQFRRTREAEGMRIVVRFDRPWAVPNRSHWHGRALARNWKALALLAEARSVANPEAFLAVASDTTAWFPVREGLDVFRALAGTSTGRVEADLMLLLATLSTPPPPSPSTEPVRFRLEYVDGGDRRSANELFASGYCVGQTRDLRT